MSQQLQFCSWSEKSKSWDSKTLKQVALSKVAKSPFWKQVFSKNLKQVALGQIKSCRGKKTNFKNKCILKNKYSHFKHYFKGPDSNTVSFIEQYHCPEDSYLFRGFLFVQRIGWYEKKWLIFFYFRLRMSSSRFREFYR